MERPLTSPEGALSRASRQALRETEPPGPRRLMEPVAMERRDPGTGWLFEPLFDGTRCLAVRDGGRLRLLVDGTREAAAHYPALEEALLEAGPDRFAIDGEILGVDPEVEQDLVLPARSRLRETGGGHTHEYRFLAFDLLYAQGYDVTAVPLIERRNALRALFHFSTRVMYVRESTAPGEIVFTQAERERWTGVIAKNGRSAYVAGPSASWRVWRRPLD